MKRSTDRILYAIADAMHEEYKAITDAGFLLQIDDPDLADAWQIHGGMSVPEYRKFAEIPSTHSTTRSGTSRPKECASTCAGAAITVPISTISPLGTVWISF